METQATYTTKPNGYAPSKAELMNSKLMAALNELGDYTRLAEEAVTASSKETFLSTLQIAETLREMDLTLSVLQASLTERLEGVREQSRLKAQIEEFRALHIISGEIDGKNAEIREAQLLLALKADSGYILAKGSLEEVEAAIVSLDGSIEFERSKLAALKYRARLIAAQLEYLSE